MLVTGGRWMKAQQIVLFSTVAEWCRYAILLMYSKQGACYIADHCLIKTVRCSGDKRCNTHVHTCTHIYWVIKWGAYLKEIQLPTQCVNVPRKLYLSCICHSNYQRWGKSKKHTQYNSPSFYIINHWFIRNRHIHNILYIICYFICLYDIYHMSMWQHTYTHTHTHTGWMYVHY